MFDIGILQGRLSRSSQDKFQFYPAMAWATEFEMARKMGFRAIEWLVEDPVGNAIFSREERTRMWYIASQTAVSISSVCADYFMAHPLWGNEAEFSRPILKEIVAVASMTRNRLVLVPFLEKHALHKDVWGEAIKSLRSVLPDLRRFNVRVGLETELPVDELEGFLDEIGSPRFGAYYDIGNCTSYGFDCPKDLEQLDTRVFGVHVKDRKVGSSQSTPLGSGDADFKGCFEALKSIGFDGTVIMQAWRGNETYLQDAREQFQFLRDLLGE